MNKITKKTAFAATGVAAAALLTVGFTAPAMADTTSDSSTSSFTSIQDKDTRGELSQKISDLINLGDITGGDISNSSPVVVAPEVGVGDVLGGGILNGNAVASGNEVTAPVASGNDTAVGSGNDTSIGNGSGNGNSVGTEVGDLVDGVLDVDGLVDDVLNDIDLNSILGR